MINCTSFESRLLIVTNHFLDFLEWCRCKDHFNAVDEHINSLRGLRLKVKVLHCTSANLDSLLDSLEVHPLRRQEHGVREEASPGQHLHQGLEGGAGAVHLLPQAPVGQEQYVAGRGEVIGAGGRRVRFGGKN